MTAVWVQRQVLDREEWVDTSVELLENDDIRRAIGLYLIDELYTNVDVAGEIQASCRTGSSRSRSRPLPRCGGRPSRMPARCSAPRSPRTYGDGRTNARTGRSRG